MKSKRLLTLLLSLCLVLSLVTPAFAVKVGNDGYVKPGTSSEQIIRPGTSASGNGLLASGQGAGALNLRDHPITVSEVHKSFFEGIWEVSPGKAPAINLLQTKAPACLDDLMEAEADYAPDEMVRAFIVLEDAPLADKYSSVASVSTSAQQKLTDKQNALIANIEKYVLAGGKLDVRYQLTYLTNSITVETEFSNLAEIACFNGVKSVFVTPTYSVCETVSNPNTVASGAMTGVPSIWGDLGFTGQGMKIAVIDSGLDLDHPSFGPLDSDMVAEYDSYLDCDDIAAVLESLNAYSRRSTITAKTLYRSTKVPYAFNYCDDSLLADHSGDNQGDHGTHVSGIAAANKLEGVPVVGMAPDAQIVVMKVFGVGGGAYADDIAAALEDAMILGCDVVNASLGSPAGFTDSGIAEIDAIYDRLATQNTIATISAGNEGTSATENMWGTDLNRTQNPENGTVGSPALYHNGFIIASAENSEVMTSYFSLGDGTRVFFNGSLEYAYGYVYGMVELLAGEPYEYVFIDGLGAELDEFFDADGNSLVEGKVAVVWRGGGVNFSTKIANAESAGAVACVIANNNDTDDIFNFYISTEIEEGVYPEIPTCLISQADALTMEAAEDKTMTVSSVPAARVCEGGQMSSFSSWGVSSDLRLVPDITGIGGNVFSCYDGGQYGVMSGTSMSSPQLAGITALVMQYLYDKYPDVADDGTIREMALALLMSTADPIISTDSNLAASPRQQGAGLVNAAEAAKTAAYLTVNGSRPKAELGDSATGSFTFTFEIRNFGDAAQTYVLSSSLLTEAVVEQYGEYFMAGYETELSGSVSFDKDSVTVAPGETVTVTVSISLSDRDKAMFAKYWANGGFVEGYVYLENAADDGVDLNLPFMGFYGDWTKAPVFDSAYWYENGFWDVGDGWPDGDEYYHVVWTDLGGTNWVLGFNPYSGAYADAAGNVVYDPANNTISPNGDGVIDGLENLYISLLRNAKTLTITFTNADTGEVLHTETSINNNKTMYISAHGQVVPWLYSWYGEGMYNFSGLANNTKVVMTVEATVDYENGGEHRLEIPFTIDTEVPELKDVYQYEENGAHYLTVVASDNVNVGGIFLMNRAGTQIYGADYCLEANADGDYVATFNVDELGTELMIVLGDYAGNEGYYNITYVEAGENLPIMPTDQLYAYRIMDSALNSDHMFGWVSMNFPTEGEYAEIAVWSDDYMEYAALTAAEYAGGKIFAVDAVYNLVVMDPGLWNRTTICNLGVSVLDLTFDDSTDTMYALVKDGYYVSLQKLDVMTGELTMVKNYGYYFNGPWAITDDDNGTLYAVKYTNSGLYTLNAENNYALTAVVDGEGNNVTITDSNGNGVSPQYSQSIAYVDGTIYWAYMGWSGSELIAIDLDPFAVSNHFYSAWAYDTDDNLVNYYPNTELVGLLTLKETDWTIPEGSVLDGLNLDAESLILTPGQSEILHVSPTPWNYVLENVEWSSDDEAVATVENGVVTAVGEGIATITASVVDVEVYCDVIVVDTDTSFHAYNFYSGDGYDGYMIEVDTGRMNYYLEAESPVEFLSGDYNGHDGYFYGYSEGGQFWRYDMKTGVAVKLGDPIGVVPADMAYDYSTGLMYAIVVDTNAGITSLCQVNLNNGQVQTVYQAYFYLMTLAADLDGNLYSITSDGYLVLIGEVYDDWFEEYVWGCEVLMEGLGELQYMQSMCYDYANDVLLWAYCEAGSVYWIDMKIGYAISMGDPTGSGVLEFVGMYTVPEEIPELDPMPVLDYYAEDMVMLTGSTKFPNATVWPFNATSQNIVWTSEDESIVRVNADGSLSALSAGTVTISGVLYDEVMDETYDLSFTVMVIEGADEIYGMLMSDLATHNGQCWLRLYATDPSVTDILGYTDYEIFAEEYYDGKVYAYGYDPMDWSGAWYYFVLDASSHAILEMHDMGTAFPFVYDMTYDYTTSTMYAVAGPNGASDFYAVNMKTGELVLLIQTEQFFMSLTASPDGTLYAIEKSQEEGDWWSGVTLANAQMYTINPATGEVEWYADTGIQCNMLASMTYDYDTDYIYWTPLAQSTSNISGLCLIDPATGEAFNLGTIGSAGSQVSGLYIICENYPEEPDLSLMNVIMDTTKTVVNVGHTVQLNAYALPLALDVEIVWTSSDESIATVDENGVVTGVSQGSVEITATVTYNGVTKSAVCRVGVLESDAAFLSWNRTDMGWSAISRADYTVVTNLTEGEEIGVSAIASVGKDVYGYDINNRLFRLNLSDFTRTIIGEDISSSAIDMYLEGTGMNEAYDPTQFRFVVRDMAYDEANDRVLVLGTVQQYLPDFGDYYEIVNGSSVYEVNLETGEISVLYTFGDYDYVFGLAVDGDGMVYFYTTFNDTVNKLDLATGTCTLVISLQSQSLYGTSEEGVREALYYDELTGMIYMTFTGNGRMYRMLSIDPATGALTILSDIGLKEYDPDSWSYIGDCFSGLTFAKHEHSYTAVVTAPTCTEQGYTTHTCACGHSYVDSYTDPTGHHYGDDGVCGDCGEKDPDFKPEENPGTGDTFNASLWMTFAVITGLGAVLVIVSKKSWLSK